MKTDQKRVAAAYHLHDDNYYLADSIASLAGRLDVIAFVSRVPWNGKAGDWERTATIAAEAGAEVVLGEWPSEAEHRQASLRECKERGYDLALIPDGDEIYEPGLLDTLIKIAQDELADRVYVEWDTYWKSPEYVVRPRERFRPCVMINLHRTRPTHNRDYDGGCPLYLNAEHGIVHHLSYVGPDARILRKIETYSHCDEVVHDWWSGVWHGWDRDKTLRDLHPTHPEAYGIAERIVVPECLHAVADTYNRHTTDIRSALRKPEDWPEVSVVIPVHGASQLLRECLRSLADCSDLLHEVIVVDNASPDDCLEVCSDFSFVKTLLNNENRGFAKACNQGCAESTGEVVLFLNSDTIVPRSGLIRLIEPLVREGTIAASGPFTNNCGHFQRIAPTYTHVSRLDLFAEDFARQAKDPIEVDMLVGFCLAVKRTALNEVGAFDERFGLGTYEDNDLCYRLRRAGWRLVIAANSFVHHSGSETLRKVVAEPSELLGNNLGLYLGKWRADLESGYASHLAGTSGERIRFDESRKPEVTMKETERKRGQADVSLCMIVRDEERVIADCLTSAKPFFNEMIVVDTGSKDRTMEIAKDCGASVRSIEWPDSFAAARNESIRGAKGKWIFWMDADDTLPLECGQAVLDAALSAGNDVLAFVVPVQFVDDGPGGGTRVDHVKLFRNLPGLQFEGRIHEQILHSLRRYEGKIVRSSAYVLHSGYDTSEQGQKKKRLRDEKLLMLDLQDRPDHPFVLFNLGMTAHYTDGHKEAIEWFEKCLGVSDPKESHVRKAYALQAVSYRELGETEKAVETLTNGLEAVGDDPELHFHLGLILSNQGLLEQSLEHYRKVLETDPAGYFSSMDVGILGFKTHHNMGGVLIGLGDYNEAKSEFLKALEQAPHFLPSAFELFDQALVNKDLAAARLALDHVKQQAGQCKSWAEMTIKYSEHVGGPENVLATMGPIAVRHLVPKKAYSAWLLNHGREDDAAMHWQALQESGDAESAYFLGVRELRRGRFKDALGWMRRAQDLNPEHVETARQIEGLEKALAKG